MTVRIVTYNLLVPILAEKPGNYDKCRSEFLRVEYRWKLIRSQLKEEIDFNKNTIICLQEVSRTYLPELRSFFRRMSYRLFDGLYGNRYNDYMGVAIAIPVSMQLISKNLIGIGDHLRSTIESLDKGSVMNKSRIPPNDPWEIAMSKSNKLICLEVIIDGKPLFIGTYHMPMLYQIPKVMIIHSSAVKDLMYQLSAGHPFILAGDFNFQPHEIAYRVITERGYARNILLPSVNDHKIAYPFNTRQLLTSAYREKNGSEPNYTNFSTTQKSPNFCATLDYIFFAGNLTVVDVLKLPNRPTGKSYPDETHPSDHLMLAASFQMF